MMRPVFIDFKLQVDQKREQRRKTAKNFKQMRKFLTNLKLRKHLTMITIRILLASEETAITPKPPLLLRFIQLEHLIFQIL